MKRKRDEGPENRWMINMNEWIKGKRWQEVMDGEKTKKFKRTDGQDAFLWRTSGKERDYKKAPGKKRGGDLTKKRSWIRRERTEGEVKEDEMRSPGGSREGWGMDEEEEREEDYGGRILQDFRSESGSAGGLLLPNAEYLSALYLGCYTTKHCIIGQHFICFIGWNVLQLRTPHKELWI